MSKRITDLRARQLALASFFVLTTGIAQAQNVQPLTANASRSIKANLGNTLNQSEENSVTSPGYQSKWRATPFDYKLFVENKGQFTNETGRLTDKILFEAKLGKVKGYFLPNGIVYRKEAWFLESEAEREKEEMEHARDRDKGFHETIPVQFQRMLWVDANPNPEVVAEDVLPYPYIYGVGLDRNITANVYRKITYKNLYPGIDVQYVFPEGEKDGFKYNVILHPGANLNMVRMKYPGAKEILKTKEGDAVIRTSMDEFTDHAPVSFYENGNKLNIQFRINGNEISFLCHDTYDISQTVTIDPWTTNPAFTGSYNQAYDIDYDNYGNILVYGGWSPAQLVKLNNAGTILWRYNATTINTDPSAQWGDFCVDKVTGRSYLVEGFNPTPTGARCLKISTAGALVGTFAGNANFEEMDRVAYNECTRTLVIAGGGTNATNQGCILDTSMTGLIPKNVLGANLPYHDMWLLAMDPTGTTCYMGSTESCCNNDANYDNRLLKLNVPALTASTFNFNSRTAFNTWMPEGTSDVLYMTWSGVPANGYNGLTCSKNNLYFYDGVDLRKLNKSTGAQIVARTGVGNNMQSYGGLDVDVCDNVYVGRNNSRIFVFNGSSLTATSAPTATLVCAGAVYDLVLGKNYNEVYACGQGFVEAFTIASPPVTFTNSVTNPTCGSCNGSITANLYECGVATAATYSWSNGATTQTVSSLCAGTYTLTVTPTTECRTYTTVVTLSNAGSLTPSITAAPSSICNGSSTVLTASGATTYTWSANAGGVNTTTVSVNPGTTTIYTVTGTSGACVGSQTISVTVNPAPSLSLTANSYTICNGSSANLSASGATTYTWTSSTGLSNPNISNPTASPTTTTIYTVTGTSSGCNSAPATATVNVTPLPTVTTTATSNTLCASSSATLTAGGASTYTWSPAGTLSSANGSPVVATPTATTTYTVTGTSSGCNNISTITVTVNPTPSLTLSPGPASLCSGASTTITATGANTYTWSANAGGVTTSTTVVTPTITTTYTVNATSAAGCPATKTVSIAVTPAPTLTLTANSFTICNGSSTGLSASGATTYTWINSTGLNNPNSATPTASPTTTTVYTVTGTSSGCNSAPATATVNVTPLPTLTTSATSNTLCTNSSATLTVGGASTFTWSPSGSLSSSNGSPVVATPTVTTTYTVTGTSSGCSNSNVLTITVNPLPTINVTPTAATVCPSGSATLAASGGNTYTWSPAGSLNTANGGTVVATPTASTTYTVSGTSAAGCTNSNTVAVAVNPSLVVSVNSPTTCAGVGVTLTANGASSYSWSPAAGLSSTTGQTVTATGTTTTQYTVTGTSGGCVGTNTATVTINPQPNITVSATTTSICAGSSTTLTASGANSYSWAPSASLNSSTGSTVIATPTASVTYFVQGTDQNGCKDTNQVSINVTPPPDVTALPATICSGQTSTLTATGATSYTWSANAGGVNTSTVTVNPTSTTVYTVTVTAGACITAITTTVTVNTTPTLTLSGTSYTICAGDSTAIAASGASTYTWTTGSGLNCTSCPTPTASPGSTTTYTVTGGSTGCTSAPAMVTVNVNSLPTISATPSSSTICSSGSTTITANGASTYTWSPAGSLSSPTGSPVVATPTANTTYTLIGNDANGCRNTATVSVAVSPTPTMNINAVPAALCAGQAVVLNGGTANTYTWSNNAGGANSATVTINPNATDTYTLSGSIGSCTASATVTVPVNPNPVITSSVVTAAPCGQNTGCVDTVIVNPGTAPFTYSWNNGAGTSSPQYCGHPSGIYTLTVTDANGCSLTQNINIPSQNGPSAPTLNVSTNSVCVGGTVTMTVSPTTPGIVYTWNDNSGTQTGTTYTASNINPAGIYTVTVTATDTSIHCSNSTTESVTVVAPPNISVSVGSSTLCAGQSAVLTAGGATTYTWSANAGGVNTNTVSVNPSANTTYTVSGSANGCSNSDTVSISVNPSPTITVNGNPGTICSGTTLTLTASGASNYFWNPGGVNTNTISVTPGSTTTYTITGDSLGCPAQQFVTVIVTPTPSLVITPSATNICSSQSATLTASGASTYTWSTGAQSSTVTVTPTNSTTYTLVGANGNCKDTTTISINVTTTPTVNIASTSTAVCAGQTATLTASGATSYTWLPSASTATTITDTPTGNTTYTLIGNTAGCTSAQQVFTITVNALPTLTVSGSQSSCSGGQISSINYNSGNTVVTWTNTNSGVGIASSGSGTIIGYTAPNVTTTQVGVITAIPTDTSTGCVGSAQDYTVTIHPNPTLANSPHVDSALCGAQSGGVNGIIVTGGTPTYTYQWYDSNGLMTGQTDSSISGLPMGTYTVVITDQNGCIVQGNATTFTVNGTPSISTAITPPLSQGQAPLNVNFSSTSSGASTYSWNFGNGQTANTQQPAGAVTYTAAGMYTVTLDVANGGCHAVDTALVIIDATPLIIVPNVYSPNGDGINDNWYITATGYCKLHCDIYNRWGQLVYQMLAINDEWNGVMNNGNHATEGTYYYILEATTCDGKTVYKADGWITLVK